MYRRTLTAHAVAVDAALDLPFPLNPDGSTPIITNADLAIDSSGAVLVIGTRSSSWPPANHQLTITLARLVQ